MSILLGAGCPVTPTSDPCLGPTMLTARPLASGRAPAPGSGGGGRLASPPLPQAPPESSCTSPETSGSSQPLGRDGHLPSEDHRWVVGTKPCDGHFRGTELGDTTHPPGKEEDSCSLDPQTIDWRGGHRLVAGLFRAQNRAGPTGTGLVVKNEKQPLSALWMPALGSKDAPILSPCPWR